MGLWWMLGEQRTLVRHVEGSTRVRVPQEAVVDEQPFKVGTQGVGSVSGCARFGMSVPRDVPDPRLASATVGRGWRTHSVLWARSCHISRRINSYAPCGGGGRG